MARADSKELVLGLLAGAAGISLAIVWYKKSRNPGSFIRLPNFLLLSNKLQSAAPHATVPNNQGAIVALQGRQLQMLDKLNCLLMSVEDLRNEVKCLKESIPKLEDQILDELKGKTDSRRISPLHKASKRKKLDSARGSTELHSSEEAESEGGYITAHTDTELESEDEKRNVPLTAEPLVSEREAGLIHDIQRADILHDGSETEKQEGYKMLFEKEEKYGNEVKYLWRLARAHGDMFEMTTDVEEKKSYAANGKVIAEKAIELDPLSADCHQWFAIMCGYLSEYESVQNKIKNGYLFKEHLDKAIELKPHDPFLYYLLGRWCYAVAQLTWIERKVAATLFGNPPSATIQEALQNFMKVEEMRPSYSKSNYVYLAKCYRDLGQNHKALKFCDAASAIVSLTNEDKESQKDLEALLTTLRQ
ncbi:regulator of microtubule dynamics protein 2 isoform X1 [Pleurodeles waltl]|uniref:regulator of microtubule dynamics protein 2 isoform X1 n=1 Tax=Pleurodeles waltl TaxID=8319 RepID=UPI00370960F9